MGEVEPFASGSLEGGVEFFDLFSGILEGIEAFDDGLDLDTNVLAIVGHVSRVELW